MHIWKAGLFLLFVICTLYYRGPTDRLRARPRLEDASNLETVKPPPLKFSRYCPVLYADTSSTRCTISLLRSRHPRLGIFNKPNYPCVSQKGPSLTSGPSRSRFSTFPPGTHPYELQFARKVRPSSSAWLRGLALVQLERDSGRYWLHARRASLTTPCSSCGQWHALRIQPVASELTGVPSGRPETSARTTGMIQRNGLFPTNCSSTEQGSRARRTAPHWHQQLVHLHEQAPSS